MQASALDLVRAKAMGHMGKARDAQARAIARARLMRDDAKLGTRAWNDANTVVEDLEAVGKLLDGVAEAVTAPAAKPASQAAPGPQRQAEAAQKAARPVPVAPHNPGPLSRRDCAAAGCPWCQAAVAVEDTGVPAVVVTTTVELIEPASAPPTANGVGVTDRAG